MEDEFNLQVLLDKIKETSENNAKLYMITRSLKEGFSHWSKKRDRFLFKVYQMEIDDALRSHLYETTTEELNRIVGQGNELIDYDVISDDTSNILRYSVNGKSYPLQDVVMNQLGGIVPKVRKWEDIDGADKELWAYCVGFEDTENHKWIYTFRKSNSSKVATKKKGISTVFDTVSLKLVLFSGLTISLDKQIDCVFYEDTFYVIRKNNFESILGLQEEYKAIANEVADQMETSGYFSNTDSLKKMIEKKPGIHKKLMKIKKLGALDNLSEEVINNMKSTGEKYHSEISFDANGHIVLESEDDIDKTIKLLSDYYKKGEVSGNSYGTYSGIKLSYKQKFINEQ